MLKVVTMPWRNRLLYLWLLVCFPAVAQSTFQLSDSDYRPFTAPTDIVFPVKCDQQGNVYFRFSARGLGGFDVVKIAPDGSQKATYTYSAVPELKNDSLLAVSADDRGEIYELLKGPEHRVILLRFSGGGRTSEYRRS